METIVISALVLAGLVWYLMRIFNHGDRPQLKPDSSPIDQLDDDPLKEASRTLKMAIDTCDADHGVATQALLWLAGTDGTISKQEARNVFRFCEQQGSTMPAGLNDALEYLNNGMTISSRRNEREVINDLSKIAEKPIQYRAAFLGAAHAICGGNKRISKVKQDFLDRANAMVAAS